MNKTLKILALVFVIVLATIGVVYAAYTMQSNTVTGPIAAQATIIVTINGSQANGTSYMEGATISLAAATSDNSVPSGGQVTFYNNGVSIGTVTTTTSVATLSWTIPIGSTSYSIHASAQHI